MILKKILAISAIACLAFLFSCKLFQKKKEAVTEPTGPIVFIYKTKADYSKNVPVTLSEDKKTIVSYPDPHDIFLDGKLSYPTALKKGYWLDNRGISPDVAFLKYTYEEYSAMKSVPRLDSLYASIIDKDPLTEMYSLGSRADFKELEKEVNDIIEKKKLKKFTKIKG